MDYAPARVPAMVSGTSPTASTTAGRLAADGLLVGGLLLGSVVYLLSLPRVLGHSDEALFLYEAKRVLEGQVFYRDVFDLITPGAHYVMAACFWLFGTDMATARGVDALVHALIVVAIYAGCRTLGVRRGLAAAAAIADPALFRPAFPVTVPHWFSTLLSLVLLLVLLRRPGSGLLAGVAAGLVICVQQQRGVPMTIGAVAVLLEDAMMFTRSGAAPSPGRTLASFACGLSVVLGPLLGYAVARAGVDPVYRALVLQPLSYRRYHNVSLGRFGTVGWWGAFTPYASPPLLLSLTAVVPLTGLRALAERLGRSDRERLRRSVVLTTMGLAAIVSILYFPDYIHLAFIGPVLVILLADLVEAALAHLPAPRPARLVGGTLATLLLLALGVQARRVMVGSWRDTPLTHRTLFGVLNFRNQGEIDLLETQRQLVHGSEVLVYPGAAAFYLVTGAVNPTPYQMLLPGYSPPEHFAETIDILERRRVPFIAVVLIATSNDPLRPYVAQHYAPVPAFPLILRRIDASPD